MVRRTVLFAGRVQGVGFRYTTCRIAADYDVTGYIRNLPDGRVEMLAEGESDEVDRFVGAVSAEMSSNIQEAQKANSAATGEFDRFDVRF
ncbi:MAG: acylphosphatase [Planctomycetota bacterium]